VSNRNLKGLLHYWSVRYFLILIVVMAIVMVTTLFYVENDARKNQLRGMKQMVSDIGTMALDNGGKLAGGQSLARFLDDRAILYGLSDRPVLFIYDKDGSVVQQFPSNPPEEADQLASRQQEMMNGDAQIIKLEPLRERKPFLVAVYPMVKETVVTGYVVYMMHEVSVVKGFFIFQLPRFIAVITMLLSGWVTIYILTRRLVKPIQEAADAAKQIVAGNYNVNLNKKHQEREVHELMHSFKEMADRLSRLEALRTQLLAGVTHELKTPVTAISGFVQAVRDGIVSGDEANQFMDMCLQESNRLQKMVEDLLDFNSFAAGAVAVRPEFVKLRSALTEMINRWRHAQKEMELEVDLEAVGEEADWQLLTDPNRLEQIMINLLNNARDAMSPGGIIRIRVTSALKVFSIQVQDTGRGIALEEQQDVFEPFYRGYEKKTRIRGMGLGLPFSRLIAQSLGGDLVLADSSPEGTVFKLVIPSAS
jgi:signal transduction histidine kinase